MRAVVCLRVISLFDDDFGFGESCTIKYCGGVFYRNNGHGLCVERLSMRPERFECIFACAMRMTNWMCATMYGCHMLSGHILL